ncbi:MAG TPA: cobalt-precorrin-5B (C(1))-methyltransferase [Methanoregulaceae archaeon]|nr:cobalt-precorrin-5B (C(1))-methyltransferase [Methanoregulaceae archaeon]
MKDPVSGFEYPGAWIEACREPGLLPLVSSGLAILTSDGTVLRRGYTTGTTAAAACKAAVLSLAGPVEDVTITTPSGVVINIPVITLSPGRACCMKYAGDYPLDVTSGIKIHARSGISGPGIRIRAKDGIGRFDHDTPRYKKGDPAISNPAMDEILYSIQEGLDSIAIQGVEMEISIPEGEAIAQKTLNPRLGITGGISLLGTTGLVEPWDDHLESSVIVRVRAAEKVVLTTGRTGLQYARIHFPGYEPVLVGNNIGTALACASGEVIIAGLPGLIIRFICPCILEGTSCPTVEELMYHPGYEDKIQGALDLYLVRYPGIRVVLFDRDGRISHDTAYHAARMKG